jgi:uncharacterized membrane protein YiaA
MNLTCELISHHVHRRSAWRHLLQVVLVAVIEVASITMVEVVWWHITLALSLFGKDALDTVLDVLADAWER